MGPKADVSQTPNSSHCPLPDYRRSGGNVTVASCSALRRRSRRVHNRGGHIVRAVGSATGGQFHIDDDYAGTHRPATHDGCRCSHG